jgi:arginine N-succinyltransferase
MEDSPSGAVVGACGIMAKVGGYEPFYSYKIEKTVFESKQIKVHKEVPILKLVEDHDGPCEIGSLFLHPDYRKKDNGRLLQLVRFLFLAEYPAAFESLVVSELRGVIDEATGRSPFWDAVGRHFFDIDFPRADYLSVVNKKFIADLMPIHAIYIPLLPAPAQEVIGKAHEGSKPALKNLEAEGFRFCGQVDIFDAGPCVCCGRDEIRSVRESRCWVVADVADEPIASPTYMVGTRGGEFRAAAGTLEVTGDGVRIDRALARVLRIGVGAEVRVAPLRPLAAPTAAAALASASRDREGSD